MKSWLSFELFICSAQQKVFPFRGPRTEREEHE